VPIKRSSYQSIECKYSLCAVPQCGTTGTVRCKCHSLARCEIPCRILLCQNEYRAESRAVRLTSTSPPVITSNCGGYAVHLHAAGHRVVRRPPVLPVSVLIHQCCTPPGVVVDLAVDSSMQARRCTSVDRALKWLECSSGSQVTKHCCDAAYKAAKCRLLGDAMPRGVTWHGCRRGSNVT